MTRPSGVTEQHGVGTGGGLRLGAVSVHDTAAASAAVRARPGASTTSAGRLCGAVDMGVSMAEGLGDTCNRQRQLTEVQCRVQSPWASRVLNLRPRPAAGAVEVELVIVVLAERGAVRDGEERDTEGGARLVNLTLNLDRDG